MQTATQGRRGAKAPQSAQPETLIEAATRCANEVHAERLAEIKAMHKQLALFEAFMPAIRREGIDVHPSHIHYWSFGKKCLRIRDPILNSQRNVTLERVLREQGMRETDRRTYGDDHYSLDLMKGHLRVCISVQTAAPSKKLEAAQ